MINTKKCLICKGGRKNDCLHWHVDCDTGDIWVWCQGKCQRGYSIYAYCHEAGISLRDFLKGEFDFKEARPNEVNRMDFPDQFITLSDPRARPAIDYIRGRNLKIEGDMYYDMESQGVVFPYYFYDTFVGAQVRFMKPRVNEDGEEWKITTLPGTRLGLLFYGWNQGKFITDIKGIIITEGAFNALSIYQSLNEVYDGVINNPWKVVAVSGAGGSKHHIETVKELKDQGFKVILAPDSDEAGLKMLKKFNAGNAITHYAFTNDGDVDWNDMLKKLGHKDFAKYFLKRIKKV